MRQRSPDWLLVEVFQVIADTRMQGLPIVNPRLTVEAVGFRRWGPYWAGVLLTPWFMNFLLLADDEPLLALPVGQERLIALPGGNLPFKSAHEPQLGDYYHCSLFSPMADFIDQESARAVAQEMIRLLFLQDAPAAVANPSRRRLLGLRA
jgi:[NiFe] hydrogenase assembly HybE family chaperone